MKSLILCLGLLATPVLAEEPVDCLAKVIYNEAKGEDLKGQLLVAKVVMNRVEHPSFPDTVCGVVNQRGQFNSSPTSDEAAWITAYLVLQEEFVLPDTDALHFHSGSRPNYLKTKEFLFQHGGHSFYK